MIFYEDDFVIIFTIIVFMTVFVIIMILLNVILAQWFLWQWLVIILILLIDFYADIYWSLWCVSLQQFFDHVDAGVMQGFLRAGQDLLQQLDEAERLDLQKKMANLQARWKVSLRTESYTCCLSTKCWKGSIHTVSYICIWSISSIEGQYMNCVIDI